jgi:DegV family protein with EDD domain
LRAAKSLEAGMSHQEITEMLPKWSDKTNVLVTASTMKYMIKSGRVSKSKGVVGSILNIKPIVSMDNEGKTVAFGKPFTFKQSMKMVIAELNKFIDGKKVWGYAISHANNPDSAHWYATELEKITGMKPEFIQHASPVLVTNVGTGVVAVTVMLD